MVVFRSDGSVSLNEMTVNVPHVSGKDHSLTRCHKADSSEEVIFFESQKLEIGIWNLFRC